MKKILIMAILVKDNITMDWFEFETFDNPDHDSFWISANKVYSSL